MAEIAERGQKKKRLQVGGKTVFTADKEEQLVSWFESLRSKNFRVYVVLPAKFINAVSQRCSKLINAAAAISGNTVCGHIQRL